MEQRVLRQVPEETGPPFQRFKQVLPQLNDQFGMAEARPKVEEYTGVKQVLRLGGVSGDTAASRALAAKFDIDTIVAEYEQVLKAGVRSEFVGYDRLQLATTVAALIGDAGTVAALDAGETGEAILAATPLYPESGGQVGDRGQLRWGGGHATVLDSQRPVDGLIVHRIAVEEGRLRPGSAVVAEVGEGPRLDTQRNHTATHLLHAALRSVLGEAAQQAGSLVEPDKVSDGGTSDVAAKVAAQIQAEMKYPGQIKVMVIRETRAVDYAR